MSSESEEICYLTLFSFDLQFACDRQDSVRA
jgi:hypothetical protein